jgi:hypothetical protein
MDDGELQTHLDETNGHLARGERRIARQRARIAEAERAGDETDSSVEFLNALLETQARHERHRERLVSELERHRRQLLKELARRAGIGLVDNRQRAKTGSQVGHSIGLIAKALQRAGLYKPLR